MSRGIPVTCDGGCGRDSNTNSPGNRHREQSVGGYGVATTVRVNLPSGWVITTGGRVYCPRCARRRGF
jgi:hypothetical protein